MKEIGFKSDAKDFDKTVRIVTSFAKLEAKRPCWIECLFCDGLGRVKKDTIYEGQRLFWIFKDALTDKTSDAKMKLWGIDEYVTVPKLF